MWKIDDDYYNNQLFDNYDLSAAFHYHNLQVPSKPEEIVMEITGENDGPNWHWILRLEDGSFAYVEGWCDYTGWDCQSHAWVHHAENWGDIWGLIAEGPRAEFQEMLDTGVRVKANTGSW